MMIQFGTVTVTFHDQAGYETYMDRLKTPFENKAAFRNTQLTQAIIKEDLGKRMITMNFQSTLLHQLSIQLEQMWMEVMRPILENARIGATFVQTFETKLQK
jgi:hypothetical protein